MPIINREQREILYHTVHKAAGGYYCGGGNDMDALVSLGLMESAGRKSFVPEEYFRITAAGRATLLEYDAKRPEAQQQAEDGYLLNYLLNIPAIRTLGFKDRGDVIEASEAGPASVFPSPEENSVVVNVKDRARLAADTIIAVNGQHRMSRFELADLIEREISAALASLGGATKDFAFRLCNSLGVRYDSDKQIIIDEYLSRLKASQSVEANEETARHEDEPPVSWEDFPPGGMHASSDIRAAMNAPAAEQPLSIIDKLAIEIAWCRHVNLTVHEEARRILAIALPAESVQACTRNHNCAVKGQGPCNGWPRSSPSPAREKQEWPDVIGSGGLSPSEQAAQEKPVEASVEEIANKATAEYYGHKSFPDTVGARRLCDIILRALVSAEAKLEAELVRLRRGDFTADEFQNLCHNFSAEDRQTFCNGCEAYQIKLLGESPITLMRERLVSLEVEAQKALDLLHDPHVDDNTFRLGAIGASILGDIHVILTKISSSTEGKDLLERLRTAEERIQTLLNENDQLRAECEMRKAYSQPEQIK